MHHGELHVVPVDHAHLPVGAGAEEDVSGHAHLVVDERHLDGYHQVHLPVLEQRLENESLGGQLVVFGETSDHPFIGQQQDIDGLLVLTHYGYAQGEEGGNVALLHSCTDALLEVAGAVFNEESHDFPVAEVGCVEECLVELGLMPVVKRIWKILLV